MPGVRATGSTVLVTLLVLVAACSGSSHSSGTVRVLYAGSLVNVMEHSIGPAFAASDGYRYQGQGAGADQLANEIKSKTLRGDVFISAVPQVDQSLEGPVNGNWVSWYAAFGTSPLVLAYNPNGRFAAALRTQPWFRVLTRPGIRVGRTDPTLDPKGQLTVFALQQAASTFHTPLLASTVLSGAQIFPEEELLGRLQSGQLDAGFFYSVEAGAAKLHTVTLNLPDATADYTVTVLNNAPDAAGAVAFVKYLLGPSGRRQLAAAGMTVAARPTLSGPITAVPAALQPLVSR